VTSAQRLALQHFSYGRAYHFDWVRCSFLTKGGVRPGSSGKLPGT